MLRMLSWIAKCRTSANPQKSITMDVLGDAHRESLILT